MNYCITKLSFVALLIASHSLHASKLMNESDLSLFLDVSQTEVLDHTAHSNKKINHTVDFKNLKDENLIYDMDTLVHKVENNTELLAVILTDKAHRKKVNKLEPKDDEKQIEQEKQEHLVQNAMSEVHANGIYKKYVLDANGLLNEKGHKAAHNAGYHIIQTAPAHIIVALMQWINKSPEKYIYDIAISAPICSKCQYLLTLIGCTAQIKTNEKGCQAKPFPWPMPPLAIQQLNTMMLYSGQPFQMTQTILAEVLGISEANYNQLKDQLKNKNRELKNKNNLLHQAQLELNNKNNLLKETQLKLTNQDNLIRELNNEVKKLTKQIKNQKRKLDNKENELKTKEKELKKAKNKTLEGHTNDIHSVAWAADGWRLASGDMDNTILIWNVKKGKKIITCKGHTGYVNSVAWAPNDTAKIASGSADSTVRIWDGKSGKHIATFKGHTSSIFTVAWSPDSWKIASGSYDKTIRIWNAKTGLHLATCKGHTDIVYSVAWAHDVSSRIASGSCDKTIRIWDGYEGKLIASYSGNSPFGSVVWSPDSSLIASGSWDSKVRIWDVKMGKNISICNGHSKTVGSVAWSPDGSMIASAGYDYTVRIWDVKTGKNITTFKEHGNLVYSVAWSPNSRCLASASKDKTVRIWHL